MPKFKLEHNQNINGYDVSIYTINLDDTVEFDKLRNYVIKKIKSMKIHNLEKYYPYFNVNTLTKEFKDNVKASLTPTVHKKKWFDVRRSRVTEFMSELLLEKEFNCMFYECAEKRINLDFTQVDKHVSGVDITGMRKDEELGFVVCEVKASKDDVPTSSAKSLKLDMDNLTKDSVRIVREIFSYLDKLQSIQSDKEIETIITFLTSMLNQKVSNQNLIEKVVFYPFLIRNNLQLLEKKSVDDFNVLNNELYQKMNFKGIIWSFNRDIDDFCQKLYDEALNNG